MLLLIIIAGLLLVFGPRLLANLSRALLNETKKRTVQAVADAKAGWNDEASIESVVTKAKERVDNVKSLAEKRAAKAAASSTEATPVQAVLIPAKEA